MNFNILFVSGNMLGPNLNSFDEGVEFAYQNLNDDREWIPLAFYSFHIPYNRDEDIEVGPASGTIATIRGYNVTIYRVGSKVARSAELKLCGSEVIQNNASLSFRWLQTVESASTANADTAYIDNVKFSINLSEEHNTTIIFDDDFNSETMIK